MSRGEKSEQKTMVAAAFDAVAWACAGMIVVVGCEAGRVVEALRGGGAAGRTFATVTSDPDAPMYESLRVGIAAALARDGDADVLVHLADHPAARRGTVARVIEVFERQGRAKAVMPEFAGKGGHPAIVPRTMAAEIVRWSGEGGLRRFWQERPGACVRVAVEDAGAVRDVDVPGDYG